MITLHWSRGYKKTFRRQNELDLVIDFLQGQRERKAEFKNGSQGPNMGSQVNGNAAYPYEGNGSIWGYEEGWVNIISLVLNKWSWRCFSQPNVQRLSEEGLATPYDLVIFRMVLNHTYSQLKEFPVLSCFAFLVKISILISYF